MSAGSTYEGLIFVFLKLILLILKIRYEYLWADGVNIRKPIRVSAPEYVDYLVNWIQDQLDDETIFPTSDCEKII